MNNQNKGEFYADLDEGTGLYCVFHTNYKEIGREEGYAFSSWGSMKDAEKDAERRNQQVIHVIN